ncbi:unnamed protein product, partial [Mesorhabditis spiculigera]
MQRSLASLLIFALIMQLISCQACLSRSECPEGKRCCQPIRMRSRTGHPMPLVGNPFGTCRPFCIAGEMSGFSETATSHN